MAANKSGGWGAKPAWGYKPGPTGRGGSVGYVPQAGPTATQIAQWNAAKNAGTTTTTNPAPVTPFLTPQQQAALTNWDRGYGYRVDDQNQRLQYAQQDYATAEANVQRSFMMGTNNDTAANAGRGLFQSSIQANDMQDLATTKALRDSVLNTNLARIQTSVATNLIRMGGDYAYTHNNANITAAANASAQTPNLPVTTTTPAQVGPTPQQIATWNAAKAGATPISITAQPQSSPSSNGPKGMGGLTGTPKAQTGPGQPGYGVRMPKSGMAGVGTSTGAGSGAGVPTSGYGAGGGSGF